MRHRFFNLYVDDFDLDHLSKIQSGFHIANLNLDQVILAQKDTKFLKIINSADLIIPDGEIIPLTFNLFLKSRFKQRLKKCAGIDLAYQLIQKSKRLALIGSTQEVIDKLKIRFSSNLVFAQDGFFHLNQKDEIIEQLVLAKPDLLLVAMGAPRQEKLIAELVSFLPDTIKMGVGGAFDVWAGKSKRAPRWMIFLSLEWLFRIIQEPSRLKVFSFNMCNYALLLFSNYFGEIISSKSEK
ncbi:MAG: UDP-N-acetyl-D-mannosamine transferase TagA [Cyanobacteriota bacterium]|jgi:N-acetylglucosaminyldiphosphoundecaprenol N-acetyl-beta-D-mannosaminyltransferase